jgi:hypothetical protein
MVASKNLQRRLVSNWTPAILPRNWSVYRLRREVGHALAAAQAILGLIAVAKFWNRTIYPGVAINSPLTYFANFFASRYFRPNC